MLEWAEDGRGERRLRCNGATKKLFVALCLSVVALLLWAEARALASYGVL